MKYKVFTVMKINIIICWVVIPRKTLMWLPAFIGTSSCILDPEDGDSRFIWNLGNSIFNSKRIFISNVLISTHGNPNIENDVNF